MFLNSFISASIRPRIFSSYFSTNASKGMTKDPKSPSFSPIIGGKDTFRYKSPYATLFPSSQKTINSIPIERPFERLIKLRRLIRKNAKGKIIRYDAWVLVGNKNGSAGFSHAQVFRYIIISIFYILL